MYGLGLLIGISLCSALPPTIPATIPGASQFDMPSKFSGRTYRIYVYRPAMKPPPAGFPVIVLTDGNAVFPLASSVAEFLELKGQAVLVVGVGYPSEDRKAWLQLRNRDLTPKTPPDVIAHLKNAPSPRAEDYGGSEPFYEFLIQELRPAIAAAYPVNPANQTLFGHSFGGLFGLGVLFRHPDSFRTFALSSPSIWWNSKAVLADEGELVKRVEKGEVEPRIYIDAGAKEADIPNPLPPGMTREEAKSYNMVGNAQDLAGRLSRITGKPGFVVRFHSFEGEDHLSVIPAALSRSMAFAVESSLSK